MRRVPDLPVYMRILNEGYFLEIELRSGKYANENCILEHFVPISDKEFRIQQLKRQILRFRKNHTPYP